jgi:hypothetical protein
VIREWWRRWPGALVGVPTGRSSAIVVDIDRKNGIDGFDALDELGAAILPDTPLAHTASGGLHVYFRAPDSIIRNTAGARGRGLGRGLDLRGDGGYVIVPSPGSGYSWDPYYNLDAVTLAPVPEWAIPRDPAKAASATFRPEPSSGLSPYAEAALDKAARRIKLGGNIIHQDLGIGHQVETGGEQIEPRSQSPFRLVHLSECFTPRPEAALALAGDVDNWSLRDTAAAV